MNSTNRDGSAVWPTAHQWRAAWLNLVAVSSLALCCSCAPSLLAQEPKLRAVFKGHTEFVTSVATTLDVKIVASGSMDGTVKIWDVATGKERATLKGHTGYIWSVVITRDGKTIASGGRDKTITIPVLES